MDERRKIANKNKTDDEGPSLEAILAEYKSEAYMAGDKRTPKNVLDARSRAIVLETLGGSIASARLESRDNKQDAPVREEPAAPPAVSNESEGLYSRARARSGAVRAAPAPESREKSSPPEPRRERPAAEELERGGHPVTGDEARDIFETITGESYSDFSAEGYASGGRSKPERYDYYGGDLSYNPDEQEEKKPSILSRLTERLMNSTQAKGGVQAKNGGKRSVESEPDYADFLEAAMDEGGDGDTEETESQGHIAYSSAEEFLGSGDYDDEAEEQKSAGDYIDPDEYAAADYSTRASVREDARVKYASAPERSFLKPIIALIAAIVTIRHTRAQSGKAQKSEPLPPEEDFVEIPPAKAARHYASQIMPLKLRGTLAAVICVILIYISYGFELSLPLPGALSENVRLVAGLCLVLILSQVMLGLDVFTNGITSLFRRKPQAESLVALSCLLSAFDAARIMLSPGDGALYVPYCSVAAISMAFAIFGNRLMCTAFRACFRTAAAGTSPQSATGEEGISESGAVLMRTRRGAEGFTRVIEEPDCGDTAYAAASPFFIVASLILALLVAAGNKSLSDFPHVLSAIVSASASFSALISFSLPFSTTARRLMQSGAAIAGWSGAVEIGSCRGIVVTDSDIFPPSTIVIENTRILEGMFADKVISYTGSLLAASGAGTSAAFMELMRRNGYIMYRVEDFSPHEGGGLTANILGEQVYVGSSGFMQLMGIRMPRSLVAKNVVFTAISGMLVGVFDIGYKPLASVQSSLVALLQSRGNPYFAIRDFNITPQLISEKFKLPAESFEFPSFEDRYRLSAAEQDSSKLPAAVLSRDNLGAMVEAFTSGRRLRLSARLCVALSLFSSAAGMLLMFFLCWSGAFDSASVGNIMTFMLLCLVPIFIISLGLRR